MKILLFGKNGQVGSELQRSLAPLGELVALDSNSQDLCGNFTNLEGIAQTVRTTAPDVIVNAAAYTAVDKAESESGIAHLINAEAPGVLAQEAKKYGAWLVHYSTDYVFDGSGEKPWTESDTPNPVNAYGISKRDGDRTIQVSGCKYFIFRSSWIHAAKGNNFARTMLRLGQERDIIKVVNDQIGAPTGADFIADVTAHSLRLAQEQPEIGGLYNIAAAGETSWYEYARFVLEYARKSGAIIKVSANAVLPISSSDFPTPAKRPLNSRLDTIKLRQKLGIHIPNWKTGVENTLSNILSIAS